MWKGKWEGRGTGDETSLAPTWRRSEGATSAATPNAAEVAERKPKSAERCCGLRRRLLVASSAGVALLVLSVVGWGFEELLVANEGRRWEPGRRGGVQACVPHACESVCM